MIRVQALREIGSELLVGIFLAVLEAAEFAGFGC